MKLPERYYEVIDLMGGRATIRAMRAEMAAMGWPGITNSSVYIVFKRLRTQGKIRLMKDGYYVTDKWLKNQEDSYI